MRWVLGALAYLAVTFGLAVLVGKFIKAGRGGGE